MTAAEEQQALIATLLAAGPTHETLCAGWLTRHLAAHLFLRGHEPWKLAGSGLDTLAQECSDPMRYAEVVRAFAAPARLPMSLLSRGALNEAGNLLEYVVHHEDVRRAGPDPLPPRALPASMYAAVWAQLLPPVTAAYLAAPVGVVLAVPGGASKRARPGRDPVRLVGSPVEHALYLMGRREVARIRMVGSNEQIRRFTDWARG